MATKAIYRRASVVNQPAVTAKSLRIMPAMTERDVDRARGGFSAA